MADGETWFFRRADPVAIGGRTLVMAIVNLTPDSFSGAGAPAPTPDEACAIALSHLENGADIIDFGAESTRPGSKPLTAREEATRLGDVVRLTRRRTGAPISIDTYHVETAEMALDQGADIVNDVTALKGVFSPGADGGSGMAELAARARAHVALAHAPADPLTMADAPAYRDVAADVAAFLIARADAAVRAGVDERRIWLDPGFGFGKRFEDNCALLVRQETVAKLGYPVLAGLSRKRMIADALGLPVDERFEASVALAVMAALNGARIVRVHDVKATVRAIRMVDAVRNAACSAVYSGSS
ncbi:MAG: dihydropteroate synthase [Planctomycetota bacterium]|jgi:dihydropteroate synthase|nr:dihydropteroate synthase [Planctomycetota bacterium]